MRGEQSRARSGSGGSGIAGRSVTWVAFTVLLSLFALTSPVWAQAPEFEWLHQFGTIGFANETAHAVATDGGGNLYVVGTTTGPLPGSANAGSNDAFVRKYTPTGIELWTAQFGTSGNDIAFAVAVGASGVYVGGITEGVLAGTSNAGLADLFVRNYDFDGTLIWTRQLGTPGSDMLRGLSVHGAELYAAGFTSGALTSADGVPQSLHGGNDAFVQKYDLSGGEAWTRQFGTSSSDQAFGVSIDDSGIYLAGITNGSLAAAPLGGGDAFVEKFDAAGNFVWAQQFGTPADDQASAISVESSGVYVAGMTSGALPGQTHSGLNDAFVRKYAADGTAQWTRQFGTGQSDIASAVSADAATGGVYVAGRTDGALPGEISSGSGDIFVRNYALNGSEVWTSQSGSPAFDQANGLSVDASGVHVVGVANAPLPLTTPVGDIGAADAFAQTYSPVSGGLDWSTQFGALGPVNDVARSIATDGDVYVAGDVGGALPGQISSGLSDAFVRKYDSAGADVWTRQFGTAQVDLAFGIAVNSTGAYVAGSTTGDLTGGPAVGDNDAFVRKYDSAGNEIWTRQFGSFQNDQAFAIAADSVGGVYVAGMTLGSLPGQIGSGGGDAFVRKYDSAGFEIWTRQFGTSLMDQAVGVAVDTGGGVYVVGMTNGALGSADGVPQTTAGNRDVFVRKYYFDGTEAWTRQFGTPGLDSAEGVTANSVVYAVGSVQGNFALPGQAALGGLNDAFVRAYDAYGNEGWTRQFGSGGVDVATAVSANDTDVYVAGLVEGSLPGQVNVGLQDAFARRYASNGDEIWTRQLGSAANDQALGISAGASGLFVVGQTNGTLPEGQTSAGAIDAFVGAFDTTPPNIISVSASPSLLWPPNHQMVPVALNVVATDAGDPAPVCQIVNVTSNEPISGLDRGDKAPDWLVTGPYSVGLRAERFENGNGRIYTITVRCTDAAGNSSTKSTTVVVPHDARGHQD